MSPAPAVVSSAPLSTLVDVLRWRARHQPDRRAYTFLADGESQEEHLTYRQLDERARGIGALLQRLGAAGERVLLLYPPGLDYVAAFLGCLYSGTVAVPAYPPHRARVERSVQRLRAIAADARPTIALTTTAIASHAQALFQVDREAAPLRWVATDTLDSALGEGWRPPAIEGEALAFLQYTSGSTAEPKGVMLSHANLLHNLEMIRSAFEHTPESRGVIWLPPYHDMGLIGGILQPLYVGFPVVLMPPVAFLQRPVRWLQAVSRYRATTSGGPSFAYDLCARKVTPEQRASLDLSAWTVAFNGAEVVRAAALDRFAEAFAPSGFRHQAFYPCYGLAEATLIVSGGEVAEPPHVRSFEGSALERHRAQRSLASAEEARVLVGCGRPRVPGSVVIVDPRSGVPCPAGEVGEIWVSSPSVAQGYWGRGATTEPAFRAFLSPQAADPGDGPFLRTGDLGFLDEGELFVTGRIKDLILLRGRNHYPEDLEQTIEVCHPALRAGSGAAFSVEIAGEERLVVVQEVEPRFRRGDLSGATAAIREAIARQHEVHCHAVVLLEPGSLPKTSSGKVQRHAARARFLDGTLETVESSVLERVGAAADGPAELTREALLALPAGEREEALAAGIGEQVARQLRVAPSTLSPDRPLRELGLDSLMLIELQHELEAVLGFQVPLSSLLDGPSPRALAGEMLSRPAGNPEEGSGPLTPGAADAEPLPLGPAPLSHGQRALWFLHRLAPESAAYTIARAVHIHGPLDVATLRTTFEILLDRHPMLRTTFAATPEGPVQQVQSPGHLDFHIEETAAWGEDVLRERLARAAQRPFDLKNGPLLRVLICPRSTEEHVLLLAVHHIVSDLWSLVVLLDELRTLYPLLRAGRPAALPPLPSQYSDYVHWQSGLLEGPAGERLWEYWRHQLAGAPAQLRLPTDRPRPSVQTYRGALHRFTLAAPLARSLDALARQQGVTFHTTLLAAFLALLHRYSGQDDLIAGVSTLGRTRAELANIVGYFVNPLPLRVRVAGAASFPELLEQVRRHVREALEHQDYPFPLLVERLQPERDPSCSPLFQTTFVLGRPHRPSLEGASGLVLGHSAQALPVGDLTLTPVPLEQRFAQLDLGLTLAETDGTLGGAFEFNTDLFDATTVARLAEHFVALLAGVVAEPLGRWGLLPLSAPAERHQMLTEWNDTAVAEPRWPVHERFVAVARQRPEAAALVADGAALTYGELDEASNRLARHLKRLGVGPESRVGICLERSFAAVLAILAVAKAGGAYVPLDPAHPAERLAFQLADSGAAVVVTVERWLERLPAAGSSLRLLCLDRDQEAIAAESASPPVSGAGPENLLCVMYTSGSTGRPKAVGIVHRGVARLVWGSGFASFGSSETLVQLAPLAFDASTLEIWGALLHGARLVVPPPEVPSLAELGAVLRRHAVSLVWLTAGLFQQLVDQDLAALAGVRQVLAGGDVLSPPHVARVVRELPGTRLTNGYGPTESTTFTACFAVAAPPAPGTSVPIGRPIAGTAVYLLDQGLSGGEPVPQGVPGELCVGGEGLARGYLGRPDLTAERFVPSPVGDGERLYRTGDLARWRWDGSLQFLGRLDDQAKIRGFRVEPGETEAALAGHPDVAATAVAVREDGAGERRLVAYVVARGGGAPRAEELREFLQSRLLEPQVPTAWVWLDSLPLSANGKVDRRRLPDPDWSAATAEYVAPRNGTEERLARIWGDLLGRERVGVEDDFFALGGHSLLATRLMARVELDFQRRLPLQQLFEVPTVAGLAKRIERLQGEAEPRPALQPIPRAGRGEVIPLSFAQQRLWFLAQFERAGAAYNMATAVRLSGALDEAALERSLRAVVARHEVLRTTFPLVEGHPVQRVAPGLSLFLARVDLSPLPEAERAAALQALAQDAAGKLFDLAVGPLVRPALIRLAPAEHVLLLVLHHIVFDGWSSAVLADDLARAYARSGGEEPVLPELPLQYADYTLWQRALLQGEGMAGHLAYWRGRLAGAPASLELPADHPRPAVQTFRGALATFAVPAALRDALLALGGDTGATLFMTLLAAFQVLLHRHTGQTDFVIGSPIANRNRPELEGLIGCFVNMLALRADLAGQPAFRELLRRVQATALGAYEHQDLPMERLVDELRLDRDPSRNPLFQVVFAFQNVPAPTAQLSGLRLERRDLHTGTAKFDLTLSMEETAGGLVGSFEYSADLFDAPTVERLSARFRLLLESLATRPEERIGHLALLTPEERRQLLAERNAPRQSYPVAACLHQLVAEQAARRPEAVAVVCGEDRLTYRELQDRANQLAHFLRRLGLAGSSSSEPCVGVCLKRSLDLSVALLGVLQAGAAYVPLDPDYPADRLAFILDDARASMLITSSGVTQALPELADRLHGLAGPVRVVELDTEREQIEQQPLAGGEPALPPDSPAYVIYTSGSTGTPKGVVVTHANVVRLLAATRADFGFDENDVWTMFHSYAFDFSVWELWGALCHGGRVVVVPQEVARSPRAFHELLCAQGVTVLNQIPSAFRQLLLWATGGEATGALALRWVIFGGEALALQDLRPWFERFGDERPRLVNMYGITETTVHVTFRRVVLGDLAGRSASRIGRAIPDLQLLVLDPSSRELVPAGVAGELYVGGAGLARGYLARPALTAERFLPNSYGAEPGARLYKSGDLALYLPDGDLEYLGRLDHQVKVRGFRIELGEIEAALRRHPAVRDCAVSVQEGSERRLVAYLVDHGEAPAIEELRRFLRQQLPEHMVPAVFVALAALPVTPSGKLDRRALPAPDSARPHLEEALVEPRSPAEKVLAEVWAEVLGLGRVGVNDNFFALGGDSILSIQVVAQARRRGFDISLPQMFEHQTIAELARAGAAFPSGGPVLSSVAPFSLIAQADRERLPVDVEDAYPLTRLQAGMIFHSQLAPESAVYHNVTSGHVRARFDETRLRQALGELAAQHPLLRTSFDLAHYGEPLQLVHRRVELPCAVDDLRGAAPREQEAALDAWLAAERQRKLDWTRAPLLRFHVHRRSEETFQISLTESHAILDGWSVASLITELFQRYLRLLGRDVPPVPEGVAARFCDFVAAERAALLSAEAQRFWRGQLDGTSFVPLPRRPQPYRPPRPREVRVREVPVPAAVAAGLRQLGQEAGVPLKSLLLAAHVRALGQFQGQCEVVTGLVSNGRPEGPDGERIVGLFLNTLPFRLRLDGGTWLDLARTAFETERAQLPYRRFPLAEVQKLAGGQALFESAFNFMHFHVYQGLFGLDGVEVLGTRDFQETELTLMAHFNLEPGSGRLRLALDYDAAELLDEQIDALAGYYTAALTRLATTPHAPHGTPALLSEEERRRVLEDWNATRVSYGRGGMRLEQLVAEQAGRSPEAVAVWSAEGSLTYAELEARANRLAHHLRRMGVGTKGDEPLVGVCLERSPELLVALLGVLKAGGAYVPLDPGYPVERLRFMLDDAQVEALVTQEELVERLEEPAVPVVRLERGWRGEGGMPAGPPEVSAEPERLAYVLYTSGSTGKPKGAANTHRGIVNRLLWMQQAYGLNGEDRVLQKTPTSFDVSVWELFWPLIAGAGVVMARPGGQRDGEYLAWLIAERGVTVAHFVPSLLQAFLEVPAASECRSLRHIVCSGEALPVGLAMKCCQTLGAALHNLYGPTEAAVDVTFWPCAEEDAVRPSLPIGKPVANTAIYLLDEGLEPVAPGAPGELYIGGVQVARGYHRRAGLTAERFLPDPFRGEPGARMYRTGDLARHLPEGAVDFLGRADSQVKIRGVRIELEEIERTLVEHPAVGTAVVAVHAGEGSSASPRLVAYLVLRQSVPAVEALQRFLRERLPDAMVPAAFVLLDALPLTPSGKLDRRALPAPGAARPELEISYVPPQTPEEQALAEVWAQVLGMERVGREDDYFALGGDSIRSISVVARARERGLSLSLEHLFRHTTIRRLAAALGDGQAAAGSAAPPSGPFGLLDAADRLRLPAGLADAYPLATLQAGLIVQSQLHPGTAMYHDIMSHRLLGVMEPKAFRAAAQRLVDRHPILRTSFALAGFSRPLQLVHTHVPAQVAVEDLRGSSPERQEAALEAFLESERRWQFDWAQPTMVRLFVHRLSDEAYQYTLSFHDSMLDGWSVSAFNTELFHTYRALLSGEPVPVRSAPAVAYRDLVALERQALASEEARRYWEDALGDSTRITLPRRPGAAAAEEPRIRYLDVPLDAATSDGLKRAALLAGVPVKSVLLAAHARVLAMFGEKREILTGLEHNGRPEAAGGEEALGLFLNTVPFRMRLEGGTWLDLARAAFAAEAGLLPFRRYPMAELQRRFGPQPLFETVFNYTHFHVTQSLFSAADVTVLSSQQVLETEFPLRAEFNRDVVSDQLRLSLHYAAAAFSPAQVAAMGEYYAAALRLLAREPEGRYDHHDLLTEAERRQLLVDWNATRTGHDLEQPFHRHFEAQARRTPGTLAVAWKGEQLTYGELNRRSNHLAWHLARMLAGPATGRPDREEAAVAVLAERGIPWLIAVLAIFKAGGVYLPLDPRHPVGRIGQTLRQSGSRLILTTDDLLPLLEQARRSTPDLAGAEALSISHHGEQPGEAADLDIPVWPGGAAYIIYTSGSTGVPKGAVVAHRGMINHLHAKIADLELTAGDRLAQTAPQTFDISVWQVLVPLMLGGSVHIYPDELVYDPLRLLEQATADGITILEIVPSLLRALLDGLDSSRSASPAAPSLRWLLLTGEALPPPLCRRWLGRFPDIPVVNAYGPTECSDDVTHHRLREPPAEEAALIPIGRPILNTRLYVLGPLSQAVPVGVPGELYVGGAGVGRGYLGDPERTVTVFLPDPFDPAGGGRLYRTGDLVRYRADGDIEFLGRLDHQVKVRGFRIELGEIEAVLAGHPGVREVLVVAHEEPARPAQLVAYLVPGVAPGAGLAPSSGELRQFLQAQLPDYMVPAHFIQLEAMPLTSNGKIDRKALPAPGGARPEGATAYVAPETEIESALAQLWCEALGLSQVGAHDNFFDLGGHSLLLIQIHARLQTMFQPPIPMTELFRRPTLRSLAQYWAQPEAGPARAQSGFDRAAQRRAALEGRQSGRRDQGRP